MKVFQVEHGLCHWDCTRQYPAVASTKGLFPESVLFVEAPDYVFEGWGYMNGKFIKPTPPEGWKYDDATGTFYPEGEDPPVPPDNLSTADQRYAPGDYLTIDGTLYRVILPILPGSRITPGTNVMGTTIENEITRISKEEAL